jgi:hypothetical protein
VPSAKTENSCFASACQSYLVSHSTKGSQSASLINNLTRDSNEGLSVQVTAGVAISLAFPVVKQTPAKPTHRSRHSLMLPLERLQVNILRHTLLNQSGLRISSRPVQVSTPHNQNPELD